MSPRPSRPVLLGHIWSPGLARRTDTGSGEQESAMALGLAPLLDLLEREEALLDDVRFRVTETVLLLAAREERFLARITDEIDDAVADVSVVESERERAVSALAQALGVHRHRLTLSLLAEHATGDEASRIQQLRPRLTALLHELETLTGSAERAAGGGLRRVAELLGRYRAVVGSQAVYGFDLGGLPGRPVRFDERA